MEPLSARHTSLLAFLLFLFLLPVSLPAGGRQEEDPVETARQLMADRRYNDAILVLTEMMKNDPDRFDQAEALIREVRTIRDRYNGYYAELIDVLDPPEGEEIDEERAYELIRSMEELDQDPNQAAVEAFSEMRSSIVFAVNDRKFRQIMEEAGALLDAGSYGAAVETYLSGFGLHRELFLEKEYGPQALNRSDALRSQAEREAALFTESLPGDTAVYDAAEEALAAENRLQLRQSLTPLAASMTALDGRRALLNETAAGFEELRLEIQTEEENDVPYLSTLRVLTRGRAEAENPEGIAGTILRLWTGRYRTMFAGIADLAEAFYQSGIAAFNEGETGDASREFGTGADYASMLETVLSFSVSQDGTAGMDGMEADVLLSRTLNSGLEAFSALNDLAASLDAESEALEPADPGLLALRRERILELRESVRLVPGALDEVREALDSAEGAVSTERPAALVGQLLRAAEERIAYSITLERETVVRGSSIVLEGLEDRLRTLRERVEQAEAWIEGTPEVVLEGADPVEVRRPRAADRNVEEAVPLLEELDLELAAFTRELAEEPERISAHPPVMDLRSTGDAGRAVIAELLARSARVRTEAAELNRQADLAVAEGELRLSEAEALVASAGFEQAREKLEQAGEALTRSLDFREDAEVRSSIDRRISELSERIITEQNRLIVRQVRELINRGRELFFQEKFIEAEQTLQRAQARWLQTNTEEEPEVNSWLERVRRALETTSGVELTIGDPLYPEMTQMLNLARKDYLEGSRLFEEGDRTAALAVLAEAERKIEFVKEPFPNNKAASILYLQILQYTQPEDFDTIFSSRFNTARRQISTAPEEAYRELKVLEAIRPQYQGMAQAIYDAEIATGIRQPPPDRAKLARARELYEDANRIVQNDIRAQFPVALAYLNEAIRLDPDYDAAVVLKDRIQAGSGGAVTVVLSSIAQQQLKQAEDLFIAGRYFEASVLVGQLLQDPENRRNPRLLELQKRIEARL